ncbi:MAG: GntR family transcriptional regulator [Planctomycetota bacterium]|jgi:DNA-binding LacI/PurR family transcriptional regulator|nr:GntR family transcriptional regulator [Planctomycetota bacterium]
MPGRGTGTQAAVRSWLRSGITRGEIGPKLPPVRRLAQQFGCSITPVHRALKQLQDEGWLELHHGSGVAVRARARPVVTVFIDGATPSVASEPAHRTSNQAARDWLLHHLAANSTVQVRLQGVGTTDTEFVRACQQVMLEQPTVVVLALPHQRISSAMHAAFEQLRAAGVAIVYWPGVNELPHADTVESDFQAGTHLLTAALLGRGCTRPLRLVSPGNPLFEQQKQRGFAAVMGAEADSLTLVIPSHIREPLAEATWLRQVLGPSLERTAADAILAVNDAQVPFIYDCLKELGITLPVAGYDCIWHEMLRLEPGRAASGPEPISIDRRLPELGRALADLAVARANGDLPTQAQRVVIQPSLYLPSHLNAERTP